MKTFSREKTARQMLKQIKSEFKPWNTESASQSHPDISRWVLVSTSRLTCDEVHQLSRETVSHCVEESERSDKSGGQRGRGLDQYDKLAHMHEKHD